MEIPQDKIDAINQAILDGRKIEAIKIYREAARCELKDAKDFVDQLAREIEAKYPGRIKKAAGCGTAVLCLSLALLLALVIL